MGIMVGVTEKFEILCHVKKGDMFRCFSIFFKQTKIDQQRCCKSSKDVWIMQDLSVSKWITVTVMILMQNSDLNLVSFTYLSSKELIRRAIHHQQFQGLLKKYAKTRHIETMFHFIYFLLKQPPNLTGFFSQPTTHEASGRQPPSGVKQLKLGHQMQPTSRM